MKIGLYDVVLLRNGLKAQVVEVLKDGECYVVDVEECHGWPDDDTIFAMPDEIATNFGTWQVADRFRCVVGAHHLELPDKSRAFTYLVLGEGVPKHGWRKIVINGIEHVPVYATFNTAHPRSNMLVVEGIYDYEGEIVEFI